MKLVNNVAAIVSLVFVALGVFWLWKLGWHSTVQDRCILLFLVALALNFTLYVFYLRARIIALEKQLQTPK
jgi:hypothetical protein